MFKIATEYDDVLAIVSGAERDKSSVYWRVSRDEATDGEPIFYVDYREAGTGKMLRTVYKLNTMDVVKQYDAWYKFIRNEKEILRYKLIYGY